MTIIILITEVGSLITLLRFWSVHPEVLCGFEMLQEIVICLKLTTVIVHVVVQSLSSVPLFAAPWTAACQAPCTLPELAQTHVHQVGDAIQPYHPLSSPSPPAFNLSQHQGLFQ